MVKVWQREGRWHAAVPLANPGDKRVPGAEIERMCAVAAEAISRATGGRQGEVVPVGPTIAGGPAGGEWHITPAREPRAYLFADSPLPGLLPRDRQGNVITPLG